jgi:hypothetical protein
MLAERGLWPQTQEADQIARKGLQQLQQGIEQAADAVLGSEAESLRRAQARLQQASEQLEQEVQDAEQRQQGEQTQQPAGEQGRQANSTNQPQEDGQPGKQPGQQSPQRTGEQQSRQATQQEAPQPGQQADQEPDQQPGQQPGQRPGQQPGQPSTTSDGGQTGRQGSEQQGQQSGEQQQPSGQPQQDRQAGESRSPLREGGREGGRLAANNAPGRPLTGNEFSEWSDQLRDVEEMLEDPDLRNRVAQVRDRARAIRAEFRRHGTEPQWNLVRSQLLNEMQQLEQRLAEELRKRESNRAMVPIDREPIPEEFDGLVQRYYQLLGQERTKDETPDSGSGGQRK